MQLWDVRGVVERFAGMAKDDGDRRVADMPATSGKIKEKASTQLTANCRRADAALAGDVANRYLCHTGLCTAAGLR